MKLQQLYKEDIQRPINPAVVVSEMDEFHIGQEVREYVFTTDLLKNFYTLLYALVNKKTGKTGVWVNGYYGSGKSHFIKFVYYCLEKAHREKAMRHFLENHAEEVRKEPLMEPTPGEAKAIQTALDRFAVETVIFNIDVLSKSKEGKEVISRIFLHRLNALRGYNDTNIALALLLEKPIDQRGLFGTFQERVLQELKEPWAKNQGRFARSKLGKVLEIAQSLDPDLDLDALRHAIKNDKETENGYRIQDLILEFQDYLSTKADNYRLVFLIDEVSQYIGSNTSLLLNLQSIIEEIGASCNNQIWIVCTAQQELKNLISNTDNRGEDFGKILGRFDTRISLESQKTDWITKKRILEKSPEGTRELTGFYLRNKGAIENQFYFTHDLYQSYENPEDFYLTYPFIPYQFRLISEVFSSFSQAGYVGEGVKNTERSILGITHFTAQKAREEELGYFIPFDLFFNEQLEKNLTHFARGLINRAYHIKKVKEDPFARRVVNALFMISNLGESQRLNFPATLENLALLLMNQVDQARNSLQEQSRQVLDELVRQNIIEETEGRYRFLLEDEIEVANLIQNTSIGLNDQLEALEIDFVKHAVGRLNSKVDFGGNAYSAIIRVEDREVSPRGDFGILFSLMNKEVANSLAHKTNTYDLVFCLHDWYADDLNFRSQFQQYVRTKKYTIENRGSARGARLETIEKFGRNNSLRLKTLQKTFSEQFLKVPVISAQQVITPSQLQATTASARYLEVLERHLAEVYKKQALANAYAQNREELRIKAAAGLQKDLRGLTPAEEEIESFLNLAGNGITLDEVVKKYEKPPFGWRDLSTIDALMQLGKIGKRRFQWRSGDITDMKELVSRAENSRERMAITIHKGEEIATDTLREFVQVVNEVMNQNLLSHTLADAREALTQVQQKIKPIAIRTHQNKEASAGYPFHKRLATWHETLISLIEERDPGRLISRIISEKDTLRQQRDHIAPLEEFIEDQLPNYLEIRKFATENRRNFETLDEVNQQRGIDLAAYFAQEDEPALRFPEIRRAYKELGEAIRAQVSTLREQASRTYEEIYEVVEAELTQTCEELGVDYHRNLLLPRESKLNEIAKSEDITRLQLLLQLAGEFEQGERKKIIDYREKKRHEAASKKSSTSTSPGTDTGNATPAAAPVSPAPAPRRTETYVIGADRTLPREIQSEADLRAYLEQLEQRLRKILQEDKIILIR